MKQTIGFFLAHFASFQSEDLSQLMAILALIALILALSVVGSLIRLLENRK